MLEQKAPFPEELEGLIESVRYKPGWFFALDDINRGQDCEGLTLTITLHCQDSYHPEKPRSVLHFFPVPAAAYNVYSWRRWLFDRVLDVERHEAMEWFQDSSGFRAFAPNHGPGYDPYTIRELTTDEDRRTNFRGIVKSND